MASTVRDLAEVRRIAERSRRFGADGALVIHPSHVPTIHDVFRRTAEEIAAARAVIDAVDATREHGVGVAVVEGRVVDAAHVITSRCVLERAAAYEPKDTP